MRLLLIGQGLNRESGQRMRRLPKRLQKAFAQRLALTGSVGQRIAKAAGISFFAYLRRTERRNLIDRWPGTRFPATEAYRNAMYMRNDLWGRQVIFMGRAVAMAFGCAQARPLRWYDGAGTGLPARQFAILPHPSGLNRWWNSPRHQREAEAFLRSAFRRARWR